MTRMGIANRITEERYNKAKAELKTPKDDERVMKKYGFKKSTARSIRNTDNFYEFRRRSTTGRAKREHLQTALTDLQEEERRVSGEDSMKSTITFVAFMLVFIAGIVGLIALMLMIGGKK